MHSWHRRIYFMRLIVFCIIFQFFIYFCWYICTSFWLVYVPVNSLFWIFWLWTFCDPVILWSTSEARIWLSIVTFSTFILKVAWIVWIEKWIKFLIDLPISMVRFFPSWLLLSKMTAHWVIKVCSIYSSYWIIQIRVISL